MVNDYEAIVLAKGFVRRSNQTYLCLCSNSVNIYVGIGVPWLINTSYNYFAYKEPLRIENAGGLSFSLLMFFATSVGCIIVLVFRRLTLGAELGGPRHWAWITSFYFMMLWLTFVTLSSLRVLGVIWVIYPLINLVYSPLCLVKCIVCYQ